MAMPIETSLRLENNAKYVGDDWWQWSVWVEGDARDLQRVRSVTYTLHPTFPDPVRRVETPANKFLLQATGWGEFTITAQAQLDDGQRVLLERWLELRDPDRPSEPDSDDERPRVFISHSIADNAVVHALREALERQGILVSTDQTIEPGADVTSDVHARVKAADVVVPIISEPRSEFVEQEARVAQAAGRPVLPIVLGAARLPESFANVRHFVLPELRHMQGLADRLVAQVKESVDR